VTIPNLDAPPLKGKVQGVDEQFSPGWKRAFENLWAYVRALPTSSGGGGSGTVTNTSGNLTAHAPIVGNGGSDIKSVATMALGQILIGQGPNADPQPKPLGNDATLDQSGNVTLATQPVTPGSYILASITVDSKGRVTAASSGTGGTGVTIGLAIALPPLAVTL